VTPPDSISLLGAAWLNHALGPVVSNREREALLPKIIAAAPR